MPKSVKLYYRHVNQGERYESTEMELVNKKYRATVPAAYTNTRYPLEYYFELQQGPASASLSGFQPGFNQPTVLYGTPGLKLLLSATIKPIRKSV